MTFENITAVDPPVAIYVNLDNDNYNHHSNSSNAVNGGQTSVEVEVERLPLTPIEPYKFEHHDLHNEDGDDHRNRNVLEDLFSSHAVRMSPGQADAVHKIDSSIASLQNLIDQLALHEHDQHEQPSSSIPSSSSACSPGFMTIHHEGKWVHRPNLFHGRYETLAETILVPLPTVSVAKRCLMEVLQTWLMRKAVVADIEADASNGTNGKWCSCASTWKFVTKKHILLELVNNTLEQLMVYEADACLRRHFTYNFDLQKWNNKAYAPETCPAPQMMTQSSALDTDVNAPPFISTSRSLSTSKSSSTAPVVYSIDNCIALLPSHHEYIAAYCNAALSTHCTIDINLCYLFAYDPLSRYVLLDLLPHVARKNNVQLRVICDLMTMESMLLKSAFQPDGNDSDSGKDSDDVDDDMENDKRESAAAMEKEREEMAFLDYLPPSSPPFINGREPYRGVLPFLRKLYRIMSSTVPHNLFQLKWWCTRDAKMKYPIKNHIKCHIFDGHQVICGGSNVVPVVGNIDCDIMMSGAVVEEYQQMFNDMWSVATPAMTPGTTTPGCSSSKGDGKNVDVAFGKIVFGKTSAAATVPATTTSEQPLTNEPTASELASLGTAITLETEVSSLSLDSSFHSTDTPAATSSNMDTNTSQETSSASSHWTDDCCNIAFLQSCPSIHGEDVILRHVLGAISTSQKSILLCMGHCNIPRAMCAALKIASEDRGVAVKIIVNSMYTCDLRGGQRDLFLSIKDLMAIAPSVEVYVTALQSQIQHRQVDLGLDGDEVACACQHSPRPLVGYQDGDAKGMFLHSKYVVVDSRWSAVGSWNMWTRGCFYEMESEVFILSKSFAAKLEQKFEAERKANTLKLMNLNDCDFFCPKGCRLCKQFGPFFENTDT